MKKGLIALLVIVLVLVLIAVISMAQTPTGYVVSHASVHDEVLRIIASGSSAQVNERADVSTSPVLEGVTASRAQQEAALRAVSQAERAEVPFLQRLVNSLFSPRKQFDIDGDGLVGGVSDLALAVEVRNDEQARLIIDYMYRERGTYKAYSLEAEREMECEREVERGDANSDGSVDVSDAFYLTDFLFGVGEAPACPGTLDINFDRQLTHEDSILIMRAMLLEEYSIPSFETAS